MKGYVVTSLKTVCSWAERVANSHENMIEIPGKFFKDQDVSWNINESVKISAHFSTIIKFCNFYLRNATFFQPTVS